MSKKYLKFLRSFIYVRSSRVSVSAMLIPCTLKDKFNAKGYAFVRQET